MVKTWRLRALTSAGDTLLQGLPKAVNQIKDTNAKYSQENSAKHEGQPKKKQQLRCMCCSRIVSTRMFTSASIHSFTYTYTDTPFDIAQVAKAWESQVAKGYMVPWCSGITSVLKHAENLDVNICYICYRCLHCIYN